MPVCVGLEVWACSEMAGMMHRSPYTIYPATTIAPERRGWLSSKAEQVIVCPWVKTAHLVYHSYAQDTPNKLRPSTATDYNGLISHPFNFWSNLLLCFVRGNHKLWSTACYFTPTKTLQCINTEELTLTCVGVKEESSSNTFRRVHSVGDPKLGQ